MLIRDDVLDVEGDDGDRILLETAIFAAVTRPVPDQPTCGRVHYGEEGFARSLRALAWRMAMIWIART